MIRKRLYLSVYTLLIATMLSAVCGNVFSARAAARSVNPSDWQAGRIIDDNLFTDANSMTADQIQSFLNAQVPNCDTNGTQPATDWGRSDLTHAQYATQVKGWPGPPYVCLKNYYEVPKTSPGSGMPANNYSGSIPNGAISAAQMIYNAAQQYHISPKVLLIKIRSESAGPLTNDSWPLPTQYTYAMGAHCPDSGPGNTPNCDPNYAGFSIQISEAAALLRYYLDNMSQSWWPYKKVGNNSILYNPNSACGSSNVNVVTGATAALYTYTPYQPNAAALAAGYGTATCGAYGNRNFWLYYNDWFGSPNDFYASSDSSVTVYTDDTKAHVTNANVINANQRLYIVMSFRNNGNTVWYNSGPTPMRLAIMDTFAPPFKDSGWISDYRVANMDQANVGLGGIATFSFWYNAPTVTHVSDYGTRFGLVAENTATVIGDQPTVYTRVIPPTYYDSGPSVSVYTDSSMAQPVTADAMEQFQKVWVVVRFRNNGSAIWSNSGPGAIHLATAEANNDFCDMGDSPAWINCARPAGMTESSVGPGGTATFSFWYKAPQRLNLGNYGNNLSLVSEGVANIQGDRPTIYTRVNGVYYADNNSSVTTYTDSSATHTVDPSNLQSGQKIWVVAKFRNNGSAIWNNFGPGAVHLATSDANNPFCDMGDSPAWINCARPANMTETTTGLGATGTFGFWYKAPTVTKGTAYTTKLLLVSEGFSGIPGDQPILYTYVNPS
jgi:hypothetical protein